MTADPGDGRLLTGSELADTLRSLWSRSHRVRAALRNADRLSDALAPPTGSRAVLHLLALDGPADPPLEWRLEGFERLRFPPAPEFLLFYDRGFRFPTAGLVLLDTAGAAVWAVAHRRPVTLDRLQRRYEALRHGAGAARSRAMERHGGPTASIVTAVREGGAVRRSSPAYACPDVPPPLSPAVLVSPSTLYRRILSAHFGGQPSDRPARPGWSPELAPHQERAYDRARHILDLYGGVVIADAVGLGKTYVGLRLIENALAAGRRALVIVPAILRHDWRSHLSMLGDAPTAGTDPARPTADPHLSLWVEDAGRVFPSVLSIESLGRRGFDFEAVPRGELVLVDEAHHFRNPRTRRYRTLLRLTSGARVVLMTATPVNNSLLDLRHLLELFAAPGAFRHLGVPDYRDALAHESRDPRAVDAVLAACVVRRTRRFLRERYGAVRVRDPATRAERELRFPDRAAPVAVPYRLAATYGPSVEPHRWIERLHFPAPPPDLGGPAREPVDTAALLRMVLLKRLESSVHAFRSSIVQQLAWTETALRAARAGRAVTRPDYRRLFRGPGDDPGAQLAFVELIVPEGGWDPDQLSRFAVRLEDDRRTLCDIHRRLKTVTTAEDDKLRHLIRLLEGPLATRKTIVFTEFRDTARYLYRALAGRPRLGLIHSGECRLGPHPASRREVIERFAPRSNRRPEPPSRERVDLLIATDVASEGLNLQDASVVVSYDLPWNPVRLMQRMGRIDRLGSTAARVHLYHFVPQREVDRLLGLMDRLRSKVRTIAETVGLDAPVLAGEAAHSAREAFDRLGRGAGGLVELEASIEGPLDPEEQAFLDFTTVESGNGPGAGRPGAAGPDARPAVAVARLPGASASAVGYWSVECGPHRTALWLVAIHPGTGARQDAAGAIHLLRSARGPADTPLDAERIDRMRRLLQTRATEFGRRLVASELAGDALTPGLPQVRVAAWLARALEDAAETMPIDRRNRIERLLEALGRRHGAGVERALAALLSRLPGRPDERVLRRIERLVGAGAPERPKPSEARVREIGTLVILPDSKPGVPASRPPSQAGAPNASLRADLRQTSARSANA